MPSPFLSSLTGRVSVAPRRLLLAAFAVPPALLAAALVGVIVFAAPSGGPSGPAAVPVAGDPGGGVALPPPGGLLVEVTGAVAHPGVYRVAKGERAAAAIAAAGGVTSDADPDRLPNMAARLQDGDQVRVPARTARASGGGAPRVAPVSLNAATAEQLAAIPGFTPELAAAAIRYRTEFGGFGTTRELVDVLQMSETNYVLARRFVSV